MPLTREYTRRKFLKGTSLVDCDISSDVGALLELRLDRKVLWK